MDDELPTGLPEIPTALPVERQPTPLDAWQNNDPSKDLRQTVEFLRPKLAYHLHRYGLGDDPLAMGHARTLAAKALNSYDPASGASIYTWLDRSLQPLSRFKRMRATAIKVPEKIQLDNMRIANAQTDFEEEHGREPEIDELADYARLSVKRLHQVRQSFKKMTGEAAFEGGAPSNIGTDFMGEALEAVWDESDAKDRRILEHRAGFGGKEVIEPKLLAVQLGLSPVELSRRSARLGAKLDEILEGLER